VSYKLRVGARFHQELTKKSLWPTLATRDRTPAYAGVRLVGLAGFEPATSGPPVWSIPSTAYRGRPCFLLRSVDASGWVAWRPSLSAGQAVFVAVTALDPRSVLEVMRTGQSLRWQRSLERLRSRGHAQARRLAVWNVLPPATRLRRACASRYETRWSLSSPASLPAP
jgi:hypothetical protein